VKSSQKHWGVAIPPKPLETLLATKKKKRANALPWWQKILTNFKHLLLFSFLLRVLIKT